MAARTTYYQTASIPIYLAWRCSKCGNVNKAQHIVYETAQESKSGFVWSKAKEKMKRAVQNRLPSQMYTRLSAIFVQASKKEYSLAKFNCRCSKCGNKEAWSRLGREKPNPARMASFSPFLGYVGLVAFVGLIGLFIDNFLIGLSAALVIAAIITSCILLKKRHLRLMKEQIAKLPKESLPLISLDQKEIDMFVQV